MAGWRKLGIRTVREFRTALVQAQCSLVRTRSTHETWKTPGGRQFTVVRHDGRPPTRVEVNDAEKALAAEGKTLASAGKKRRSA